MLVRPEAGRTAVRGHGAAVFSPRTASRALGARVGHVFVTTSLKVTVPSPGFAGANRRRPKTSFPRVTVSSGRLAQLCFRQAVLPRLAPRCGRHTFSTRTPGSPARGHRKRCPVFRCVPARGRRRFAPPRRPSREQATPRYSDLVATHASCTPLLLALCNRLDAGPSAGWTYGERRVVSSGWKYSKAVQAMPRVIFLARAERASHEWPRL